MHWLYVNSHWLNIDYVVNVLADISRWKTDINHRLNANLLLILHANNYIILDL